MATNRFAERKKLLQDFTQVYGTDWKDARGRRVRPFTPAPAAVDDWVYITTNESYPRALVAPVIKGGGTTLGISLKGARDDYHFTVAPDNFANRGKVARPGFHFNPPGRQQWKFDTEGHVQMCKLDRFWSANPAQCEARLHEYLADQPELEKTVFTDEELLARWLRRQALAQRSKLVEKANMRAIQVHDRLVGKNKTLRIA